MSRKWDGFTLIELLVVVAIVGVLVAISLPALRDARRSAHAVVGLSNLRQLQIANHGYANDHDDRFVAAAEGMSPGAPASIGENLRRWHGTRTNQSEPFRPEGSPIGEYLDSDASSVAIRECPAFASTLDEIASRPAHGAGFERSCGGYGYNMDFVGSTRGPMVNGVETRNDRFGERRAVLRAPSRTVAFADAAFAASDLIEYSFIHSRFRSDYADYRWDPSIHFRQVGRGANTVWLDGHGSRETMEFTWSSGLYAANPEQFDIGWFGTDDDNRLFGGL